MCINFSIFCNLSLIMQYFFNLYMTSPAASKLLIIFFLIYTDAFNLYSIEL